MSIRQAAANLLKKLRWPAQTVAVTSVARVSNSLLSSGQVKFSSHSRFLANNTKRHHSDAFQLICLYGPAALIIGINVSPALAEEVSTEPRSDSLSPGANVSDLRKIEDGSVVSNVHTSKWRVFTDNGRDMFLQGKLEQAEHFFQSATLEAKAGFGERDPHVASAYNNLAELYRVKKAFDKAEPLYLEAINILEEAFGLDDIRVGAALHNLGQFYLVQRELEKAQSCYERALKIKRRVLGEAHTDYADTMYHLGTVLYLQGKEKDAEALIQDSIRILEEAGLGESSICIRRLRYLSQIYIKSNRFAEAENVQRKIMHVMELSKGWKSLDTVAVAESLALTLLSVERLREARELLERCLDARNSLLPEDHVQCAMLLSMRWGEMEWQDSMYASFEVYIRDGQIAMNFLYIARVNMLSSNQLRKTDMSKAISELDNARDHLLNSTRIAGNVLVKLMKQKGSQSKESVKDGHSALIILLQSLNTLGVLEINKLDLLDSRSEQLSFTEAEDALLRCISAYKEHGAERPLSDSPEVKAEYLSCLKHLFNLMGDGRRRRRKKPEQTERKTISLQELKDEIERVETELSNIRNRSH